MKLKLTYFFLILTAIVAGFFLGKTFLESSEPVLVWMGQSLSFGFDPIPFDLQAFDITFGMHFSINFVQVILIAIAVAISPKIAAAIK